MSSFGYRLKGKVSGVLLVFVLLVALMLSAARADSPSVGDTTGNGAVSGETGSTHARVVHPDPTLMAKIKATETALPVMYQPEVEGQK